MSVIKINALTVPAEMGPEVARRFADRVGAVDGQPGFLGFELLQPADERTTWLVVTRWESEEAFEAWKASPAFAHGHRPEGAPAGGHPGGGHGGGHPGGQAPLPIQAELWSYTVAVSTP